MKRSEHLISLLAIIAALACLVCIGCAGSKPVPGERFPCAAEGKVDQTIAPEAELTDFTCVVQAWEGSDTLHFNVALKNVSDQPQRYRVHIFMDNGKAVGGLIPVKTKDGLVAPGQTASFVYPVVGMDRGPKSIELIVTTTAE
jgi:hypothetical protein